MAMSDTWEEDIDPWIVKGVSRAFENAWFAVDSHTVIHPHGAEGIYSVVRPHRVAVGVLPGGGVEPSGLFTSPLPGSGNPPSASTVAVART